MPELLAPGVFIQEPDRGVRPIEGVSTSTTAFLGFAPSGPANRPVLITSWAQYCRIFSGIDSNGVFTPYLRDSYLSHCVEGFFANGGRRCYVTRAANRDADVERLEKADLVTVTRSNNDRVALTLGPRAHSAVPIRVVAERGDRLPNAPELPPPPPAVNAANGGNAANAGGAAAAAPAAPVPAPAPAPGATDYYNYAFHIKVYVDVPNRNSDTPAEKIENLVLGLEPSAIPVGFRDAIEAMRDASRYVVVTESLTGDEGVYYRTNTTAVSPTRENNLVQAIASFAPRQLTLPRVGATREQMALAVLEGSAYNDGREGISGMEVRDDVSIICFPDLYALFEKGYINQDVFNHFQSRLVTHCEMLGDRMVILDVPHTVKTPQQAREYRLRSNIDSKYATLYYPWARVTGPDGKKMSIPICGHLAGVWARSDNDQGVHKAPANEILRGVGALEPTYEITRGEQETLNPIGVNCVRTFPNRGVRVWGARTLSSDPAWRYISVRRLFNFVEKSVENNTQWVVFEGNEPGLWARVRRDISAFLTGLWRDGMLYGTAPSQAFYVNCDETLNTEDVRDRGIMIVEIGLAPVKPAEFVVIRFSQFAGGGQ